MKCAVCQRETETVTVGSQLVCSVCGTPFAGQKPARTNRPVMDVMSKRPPDTTIARAASDLHKRVKSPHVVDLRDAKPIQAPAAAEPETPAIKIHTTSPAQAPNTGAHERHVRQFTDRFEHARTMSRSMAISKFGQDRFGNIRDPEKMYDKFGNPTLHTLTESEFSKGGTAPHESHELNIASHSAQHVQEHVPEMPHLAVAQHQAMTRLTPAAPPAAAMPKMSFTKSFAMPRASGPVMATAAAVVVMAGYIWTQNYPKMALQNADSSAGISASLPGFVPSSYNLSATKTRPGQITLNYRSPSATQILKIAQARTTWDTNSLLDEFVSQNADDYAAVQGEGLTIYMYNDNDATWVNHGIWYTIQGAAQLSRDQILKIAYSL